MSSARQKPEDSAEGCRAMATSNREQAATTPNEHMRATLQRSAEAWTERASLLDRLEARFNARAAENIAGQPPRLGMETSENG